MGIVIGFFTALTLASFLISYFTSYVVWIGLGAFILCVSTELYLKIMNDQSGDAGLAFGFLIIVPSFFISLLFLVAGLIKYLCVGHM